MRPEVHVLMLTALGTTDDKLEGSDAGADDYMVKPFDFRELNARVGVLLKRRTEMCPYAEYKELVYSQVCTLAVK